jgi:hypothetical protein
MHPAVMENGLTPRPASTQRLSAALLQRDDRIVAFSGNVSWSALFRTLKAQHFVFENLAQIWAQG